MQKQKPNNQQGKGVMPKPAKSNTGGDARCLAVAKEGVETGQQLARYLSALMSDVIEGAVSPIVANAGVNAAGKLLKTVEMQQKYGTPNGKGGRVLNLCVPEEQNTSNDERASEIAALESRLALLKAG